MDSKADQLMEEGEKKLKGFALFSSKEDKAEKAREKFVQAATQYKAAGSWSRAANAYLRASDMATATKSEVDFISDTEEAAKMFKKANDPQANVLFERIVDLFDKNQKYSQAAKYCTTIAEMSSGKDAIAWMDRAARYYRNDGSRVTANDVTQKMGDVLVKNGDYDEAAQIFEKQAKDALDDRLSRGGARKLFFMALLCHFANLNAANVVDGIELIRERFHEFQELDTQFNEHTREHMLVTELIDALEAQDIEKFEDAVTDYDGICPLDEKKQKMLLRAKQVLRHSDIK